jgi:putative FmdB family regulatory protein
LPTYVYKCVECDNAFEIFQKKTTRARARRCSECGGRAERQISGGAGFLFKGSGFYTTDYRSDEYRSKASADKETGPDKSEKQKKKKTGKKPKGGDNNAST